MLELVVAVVDGGTTPGEVSNVVLPDSGAEVVVAILNALVNFGFLWCVFVLLVYILPVPIEGNEVTEPWKPVEAVMVALEVETAGKWENFDF